MARYLQDLSNDDVRDAGLDPNEPWVVRRTTLSLREPFRPTEMIELCTFAGGLGSRWAERRTSITSEAGGQVEVSALWVSIDPRSGAPVRVSEGFLEVYGEAAGGRKVSARPVHLNQPVLLGGRSWQLRSSDFDPLGHVNNAATWEPIEDELDRLGVVPKLAELEYREAIGPGDDLSVRSEQRGEETHIWLSAAGSLRASAVVSS